MANTSADKLSALQATKANLKAALAEKGQTVGDVFSTYPDAVRSIETKPENVQVTLHVAGFTPQQTVSFIISEDNGIDSDSLSFGRGTTNFNVLKGSIITFPAGGDFIIDYGGSVVETSGSTALLIRIDSNAYIHN